MANFNKPKCQCWWWNLIHMESYSPRNAAWEQYLEYQKGVPQHGIFMLIASTWRVQDGSTALGLSHSEEQDHELWQHLQGSLGELVTSQWAQEHSPQLLHSLRSQSQNKCCGSTFCKSNSKWRRSSQFSVTTYNKGLSLPPKPLLLCACSDPAALGREWPAQEVQTGVKQPH